MRGFAADAAEPVVGELHAVRAFQLGDDGLLFPLVPGPGPWKAGTNTATCTAEESHAAPDPGCTCGFYAYFEPAWVYGGSVAAVVSMWGQTIVGSRGVRAQFARIEAVCLPPDVDGDIVAAVRAAYPGVAVRRDAATMFAEHPLTPRPGPRWMHLRPATVHGVWRARLVAAGVLLLALGVAAAVPALHPETWGTVLRCLAAALAVAPLVVRRGPVPRWRETWLVGRPAWLTLLAVSFLTTGGTAQQVVGCAVATAVVVVIAVTTRRQARRATPIKPNRVVLDLLRRRGGTGWAVGTDTTRHDIRQIDSRRAEPGASVRYLAHMTFVRMSPSQRVGTATRVLTAAAEYGHGGTAVAIVEALPSAGWVEVLAKAVPAELDASLPLADVVGALGLPAPSLGRSTLTSDGPPPGHLRGLGHAPGTHSE